ncbi:MAG: DUF502 domain-containing protein [Chlamydiae bacterium]|nr:DUF502 domain-containing protein [Chlamydiota bacterium]
MKKYLITGMIILLPLAVTIGLIAFIVKLLTNPFVGWVTNFLEMHDLRTGKIFLLSQEQIIFILAQLLILLSLFIFTLFLGTVTRWFFIKTIIDSFDALLLKIPFVNKIYKTSQEIIRTLFSSEKNSFKEVVLAPFPNKNTYTLGLISKDAPKYCSTATGKDLITVFVMTAPNPTTGYLLLFKREELVPVNMKIEDAVKYIISCGILLPDSSKERDPE